MKALIFGILVFYGIMIISCCICVFYEEGYSKDSWKSLFQTFKITFPLCTIILLISLPLAYLIFYIAHNFI